MAPGFDPVCYLKRELIVSTISQNSKRRERTVRNAHKAGRHHGHINLNRAAAVATITREASWPHKAGRWARDHGCRKKVIWSKIKGAWIWKIHSISPSTLNYSNCSPHYIYTERAKKTTNFRQLNWQLHIVQILIFIFTIGSLLTNAFFKIVFSSGWKYVLFAWLISRTFSANEQYFSLTTNQPTVLSAMVYQ